MCLTHPMCIVLLSRAIPQHLQALAVMYWEQRPGCNALLNSCTHTTQTHVHHCRSVSGQLSICYTSPSGYSCSRPQWLRWRQHNDNAQSTNFHSGSDNACVVTFPAHAFKAKAALNSVQYSVLQLLPTHPATNTRYRAFSYALQPMLTFDHVILPSLKEHAL